jgi:CHAT domain-containing protein/tetratricopeptide (TPR) repeat protein
VRGDRAENLERAIACHQAALQVHTPDASPMEWAKIQQSLGNAYRGRVQGDQADNWERAIACYKAALQVRTREALPILWATTQGNLGGAYADRVQGDRADNLMQAIDAFQAALAVFEPSGLPVDCRRTGRALGHACSEAGRWNDAVRAYRIALDAADVLYASSLLRSSKEAELAEAPELHLRAAFALARVERLPEAVVALEQGRARGLGEALARDRADLVAVARRDAEAYQAYHRAAERVRRLEASERRNIAVAGETAAEVLAAHHASFEVEEGALRAAEESLGQEAEAARAELARAIERIRWMAGFERFLAQPSLRDIALVVTSGWPLAYLAATSTGCLVLLVSQPAGNPPGPGAQATVAVEAVEVAAGEQPLTAHDLAALLVARDGAQVTGGYLVGQLESPAELKTVLAGILPLLGERLIGPLAARLRELGAHGVVLIGCGHLGLLPLHAASYQRDEDTWCLLDEFDVAYAPSARVLGAARSTLSTRQYRVPMLAGVGNPLPNPTPLPFAQAEVEEVAACFVEARPAYGEAATKPSLLAAAAGATHVHLACHGRFDPAEPLRSELLLAGDGQADPLSLREIIAERPFAEARLVVASACQTAITDFNRLPDEAIGLPAGFLEAGTPGMVGTLWQVADLSTALMMARFYQYHLRGDPEHGEGPMGPARALRLAQRWLARVTAEELTVYFATHQGLHEALRQAEKVRLPGEVAAAGVVRFGLEDPTARPFASPYYWAPFVFVGT